MYIFFFRTNNSFTAICTVIDNETDTLREREIERKKTERQNKVNLIYSENSWYPKQQ